jgi:hypothetical protein
MSFDILSLVDPLLIGRPPLASQSPPDLGVMPSKGRKQGRSLARAEHGYRKEIKVGRTGFPR